MMDKVYIVGPRPPIAPEGATIWNAARPLYGQYTWTADFITGIFYAAQSPNGPTPNLPYDQVVKLNSDLDARELVFIDQAEFDKIVDAWAVPYARKFDIDLAKFDRATIVRSFQNAADERYILVK